MFALAVLALCLAGSMAADCGCATDIAELRAHNLVLERNNHALEKRLAALESKLLNGSFSGCHITHTQSRSLVPP